MKTFVNIFNELNESETEAYSIKKKVLIESNEIKVINEKCATNKELNEEPTKVENKEERLANLKTQLEQDGDQLSDDEKEAIENEIADLEKEVYPEANLNEDSDERDEDSDEQDEDSDEQDEDEETSNSYTAISYYDDKLRGVEDETSSSDWSVITDFAHDKLMGGSYVKITNTTTGKEKVISPDTYQDEFDGEFVVGIGELDESVGDKSQEETLDEDSDDFTTDMNTILDAIKSIDVTSFGTHKAEEVVDTLIDICNRQINREGPEIIDDSNADLDKDSNIDSDSDEESEVEPIQDSEKKPVTEAATKGLKVTQNQGNIYMLEDENKKIYVGENYNENEHILENAEIYDSAEDAQKDYLSRCDITKTEN